MFRYTHGIGKQRKTTCTHLVMQPVQPSCDVRGVGQYHADADFCLDGVFVCDHTLQTSLGEKLGHNTQPPGFKTRSCQYATYSRVCVCMHACTYARVVCIYMCLCECLCGYIILNIYMFLGVSECVYMCIKTMTRLSSAMRAYGKYGCTIITTYTHTRTIHTPYSPLYLKTLRCWGVSACA